MMSEREIFEAALDIADEADRKVFLTNACAGDSGLFERISGALLAHQDVGSFLERPAILETEEMQPGFQHVGQIIGPYQLKERLGAGGMGIVWAAEQRIPIRRKVAIKVIKPGMDSEQVLARFEAEREALSLMDHPNIATVLDAGTTNEGRPYFVMELIRGVPITEYCDANKSSIEDRLKIFMRVCRAVQHAHQKGIIHRDIKPQNVLVTEQDGEPVPKVIDFGVAKALNQSLTERSIYSGVFQAIGTMAYMSPEQAGLSAGDVDSRADVYGLGALLYELLAGVTPIDKKSLASVAIDEACRIIREQEPLKPSLSVSRLGDRATVVAEGRSTNPLTLGKTLYGDVDLVVMCALEKDRRRRYDSASSLAEDIRRILDREPVSVPPPSRAYRLRRFGKQHKGKILAASIAITTLFTVSFVSVLGRQRFSRLYRDSKALAEELSAKTNRLNSAVEELEESQRNEWALSYASATLAASMELIFASSQASSDKLNEAYEYAASLGKPPGIECALIANQIRTNFAETGGTTLGHVPNFVRFDFSPDGKRLALPARDTTVRVFDFESNDEQRIDLAGFDSSGTLITLAATFIPEGSQLLVGAKSDHAGGQVHVFVPDGREYQHERSIDVDFYPSSLTVSPNGDFLVVSDAGGRTFVVYSTDTWKRLWDHEPGVNGVAFLDDGNRLVTVKSNSSYFNESGVLTIWNTANGEIEERNEIDPTVRRVHVTPDSTLLITRADLDPIIWDMERRTSLGNMASESDTWLVEFSGSSPHLMAQQRRMRSLDLIEWETSCLIGRLEEDSDFKLIRFSSDGSYLATLSKAGRVKLWNLDELRKQTTRTHPTWSLPLVRAQAGREVAMASPEGGIRVWSPITGRSRTIKTRHEGVVKSLAWAPDGSIIASGGMDGTIELREASSGRLVRPLMVSDEDPRSIWTMAFDDVGRQLATGDTAGNIRIWDIETGEETCSLALDEERRIQSLQFDEGGKHLWSADGARQYGELRFWDLEKGTAEVVYKSNWRVDSVKISPDGKWVACATRLGDVLLFSKRDRKLVWNVKAAGTYVAGIAFTEDSSRLFCAALDSLSVLSTEDGMEMARLSNSNSVRQVLVMPNDEGLVTAAANGMVRYWPLSLPE